MKTKSLLLLLLCAASIQLNGQKIDLANSTQRQKIHVSPGISFTLSIENMLLGEDYTLVIDKRSIPIPPFDTNFNDGAKSNIVNATGNRCDKLRQLSAQLDTLKNEAQLAERLDDIRKYIMNNEEKTLDSSEKLCFASVVDSVRQIMRKTFQNYGPYSLKRGEELEVTISRGSGDEKVEWVYVYSAGARGEWQLSYGFTFITQQISPEKIYYSSQTSNGFEIKKEAQRQQFVYAPSLFFTWMPAKRLNKNFSGTVSGGIGYDFTNPTLFLGPTLSFNQNIKIHAGLVAHKQKVLLGQYVEGQEITQLLNEDQLHKELYRLNWYFSVSYRFSQNPFAPK